MCFLWAPVGTGKCPFRGPTSTPKDIWNTWYHWRRWMCLDGKINQASHLIGASTFFVCDITPMSSPHQPELMERFLLTGQIWYYLNGFRIFVQIFTALSQDGGLPRSGGHEIGPPVPILSLLYTFWQERHDINDVKFQSVCLKIAGKLERCSCFQKSGPVDPVAFGWVTIQ